MVTLCKKEKVPRGNHRISKLWDEIRYLQRNFFVDSTPYDIVIGYRADDSYSSFAQDFVTGTISMRKFSEAMRLANWENRSF